ncbi:MAG: FtsX-like permease family protein [Phycisphaerales bacterium]
MSALHRKLVRDLVRMAPQLAAAALVMACGIATLVMSLSAVASLEEARSAYYERYRFPHVFTHLKRAPNELVARIAEIPGVSRVSARVVVDVNLSVPGMDEPAVGRIVSIPDAPPYGLSELHLRRGRLPEPGREGEVAVSEAFAEAHGFEPGATVDAVINGRLERLTLVGFALSPEYIYQVRPGDFLPDERRFAIFWMPYRELAPAFDLDGAFNDVALALSPGASVDDVIAELDRLTAAYGGQGAYSRAEQTSDKFISNEMRELRTMALLPPTIFLTATAFILNIVFSRIVRSQREQLAALKAFGYGPLSIAMHYVEMALVVAAVGSSLGLAIGWGFGQYLTELYARFFRFPVFGFAFDRGAVALSLALAVGGAIAGALVSVLRASRLPPAEALRAEAPPDYRATLVERLRIQRLLGPAGRMVLRHLERQPLRAVFSTFGISLALAVLVVGSFVHGAIRNLNDFIFFQTQRQDIMVTFVEAKSSRARHEIEHLPGVLAVEPFRAVPTRIRAGPRSRLQGVIGTVDGASLNRLVDENGAVVPPTPDSDGLVLGDILAELLDVQAGDRVVLEVLDGNRPIVEVPIAAVAKTYVGEVAQMSKTGLNRLMREDDVASGAYIDVDDARLPEIYETLKEMPGIASVTIKRAALEAFDSTIGENILRMRLFNLTFASIIAFGVIYNSARIALAERAHELATLRILGFTRHEVSGVLLGELAVLTIAAIPLGLLLGRGLVQFVVSRLGGEIVRIPPVVNASTYVFAVTVILAAALVSGLVVRRRVDSLNLVEVLKTKG